MMRWMKHQWPRDTSFFDELLSRVDNIDRDLEHLDRVMDVEGDEFNRIMRVDRYSLHTWRNKQFSVLEVIILEELSKVADNIYDARCQGFRGITLTKMEAKEHLKGIASIFERVIEGSSLAREVELIARPDDLDDIARLLVSDDSSANSDSPMSVFPIIGMPGSGKTFIVYFLFHHHLVKHHFDHSIWIRWKRISGVRSPQEILEIVQQTFNCGRKSIDYNTKIMVVIDDLSNEGGKNWFYLLLPLLSAFAHCKFGTKIIVTSSSTSLDSDILHKLPLSKGAPFLLRPLCLNDTLPFFQIIAFRNLAKEDRNTHLDDLTLAILNKCANNLRVIRTVASILSSQPPHRWKYVNEVLLNMPNPDKHILETLDLMQQPNFLNYFSLLPHYEFSKMEFYQLWNALGDLTEPFKDMYDTLLGNEYIFQCSKRDKSGDILYYKIHDLVLQLIKHLPCYKYYVVENPSKDFHLRETQHVRFIVDSYLEFSFWYKRFYAKFLLFSPGKKCKTITIRNLNHVLENAICLEALDLAIVNCRDEDIIDSLAQIGRPLRYLRLGVSPKSLPQSITKLVFLQTLDLRHSRVQELPEGFHNLSGLRHLYIGDRLIDLPPKFGELTELRTLDVFIVGYNNGLDALTNFTHLAGNLKIRYQEGREVHILQEDATILRDKKLHELTLQWLSSDAESGVEENHQNEDAMELELLQLPSTLKIVTFKNWKGEKFPQWAIDQFSSLLSNLVSIHITDCSQCKLLPSFSKLGCLKFLELWGLIALEWIEISDENSIVSAETPYFPSLEYLSLLNLPQLKGWSSKMEKQHASCIMHLDVLSDLRVSNCPELLALPLMPNLKSLEANNCQGDFLQQFLSAHASQVSSSSASAGQPILQSLHSMNLTNMSIPECLECVTTLEELSVCWLYNLRILPESIGRLIQLRRLAIRYVPHLAELPESLAGLSALEHIELRYCPRLKQVPEYFSDLKSLRRLEIKECVNLKRRCQQSNGEDWPLIQHIPEVKLG